MNRLTDMDLRPGSPAAALAAALQSMVPLQTSPDRRAALLVRVLVRRRAGRPAFRALLSPAALALALLSLGLATAAAEIAPHLGWRLAVGTGAPVVERRPREPRPALLPAVALAPVPLDLAPPAARPVRPPAAAHESPARLMAAVHALRTDRQPARAERLALDYLRTYPRGALAEEALALAVQAGALAGDSRAASLATRYLRQYPRGRFRHVAEQALTRLR